MKGINMPKEKNRSLRREVGGGDQPRKSRNGETMLGPRERPLHLFSNITCLFAKPSGSAPSLLHQVTEQSPMGVGVGLGSGGASSHRATGDGHVSWATGLLCLT